jgi:hypothetical protein
VRARARARARVRAMATARVTAAAQPLGVLVVWGRVLWDGLFGLWEGWESGDEWILPSDEGFWGLRYVHINSYVNK